MYNNYSNKAESQQICMLQIYEQYLLPHTHIQNKCECQANYVHI